MRRAALLIGCGLALGAAAVMGADALGGGDERTEPAATPRPAEAPPSSAVHGLTHADHVVVGDAYTPRSDCEHGTNVPLGQATASIEPEPLGAVWCYRLGPATEPTRVEGENSWVDEFTTNTQMQAFGDGDFGYRVFDSAGRTNDHTTRHFINNNHWMSDSSGAHTGGSSIRPDRSFRFEDGVIVVEADAAAAIPEYGREAWMEFTVTSAPEPAESATALYAYGQFGGHWSFGCRLEDDGHPTCALFAPEDESAPGGDECSSSRARVLEVSNFQVCGDRHFGGGRDHPVDGHAGYTTGDFWRSCEPDQMDMHCRDRLRMELRRDGVRIYANGVLYFEDSGWPPERQLPDELVEGPVYVYQSEWQYRTRDAGNIYRFHWDHFAVNPPGPRTASPSFCLGEPGNTCPMATSAANDTGPATTALGGASSAEIDIVDFAYDGGNLEVEVGTEVRWTNRSPNGLAHTVTVTSTEGLFDSGLMGPGETFTHTFAEPGEYPYVCLTHPSMTGTITVVDSD